MLMHVPAHAFARQSSILSFCLQSYSVSFTCSLANQHLEYLVQPNRCCTQHMICKVCTICKQDMNVQEAALNGPPLYLRLCPSIHLLLHEEAGEAYSVEVLLQGAKYLCMASRN